MTFVDILLTLLRGAGYTFLITVCCAATALVAGLGIAIARELGGAWLSAVLSAWVYVFRGVPMLVLLFIVFFGLPGIGIDVPPLLAMMLSLGLISGAYLAEVFRGAFAEVNPNEDMKRPTMPPMKPTGRKTASKERVVARTARPISRVPSMAAWNGCMPFSSTKR